jgi:hypothetical protein
VEIDRLRDDKLKEKTVEIDEEMENYQIGKISEEIVSKRNFFRGTIKFLQKQLTIQSVKDDQR